MAQATFSHGYPVMVPYTPTADVAAGDVIVVGDTPMVAHDNITAGRLGDLAVGGGVYRVVSAGAISAGTIVYWDDTNNKVTASGTGNKAFGIAIEAASAANETILVWHHPQV